MHAGETFKKQKKGETVAAVTIEGSLQSPRTMVNTARDPFSEPRAGEPWKRRREQKTTAEQSRYIL